MFLTREFFTVGVSTMQTSSPSDSPGGPDGDSTSSKGERSKSAAKKPSSFYMKQMRAGLSAAGYVKHETWVLPENRSLLKQMEKQLRQPILAGSFMSENYMSAGNNWNCLLYTSPSPRDLSTSRMPSSA